MMNYTENGSLEQANSGIPPDYFDDLIDRLDLDWGRQDAKARTEPPTWHTDIPPAGGSTQVYASTTASTLKVIRAPSLQGIVPPDLEWAVPGWIPMRQTTGLSGDGGTGKSLLMMMLQASAALGRPWLGLDVMKTPSLGYYCEDDEDEIHRRVRKICAHHNVDIAALEGMNWISRVGENNSLFDFDPEVLEPTPLWGEILKAARAAKARLVIIDTAADVFYGNENRRDQVRLFVQGAMNRLAREIDGAVVLCAHPSVAGLTSGSGTSGSTGWSNTFRSRQYLHTPAAEKDEQPDLDARILTSKKSNYGQRGQELTMRWRDGVFIRDGVTGPDRVDQISAQVAEKRAEDSFLDALDELTKKGVNVSHATGKNYAPQMMMRMAGDRVKGLTKSSLIGAMNRLIQSGRVLCNQTIKTGTDRKPLTGLARAPAVTPCVSH